MCVLSRFHSPQKPLRKKHGWCLLGEWWFSSALARRTSFSGWFQKTFHFVTGEPWGKDPNSSILFRWVGEDHQLGWNVKINQPQFSGVNDEPTGGWKTDILFFWTLTGCLLSMRLGDVFVVSFSEKTTLGFNFHPKLEIIWERFFLRYVHFWAFIFLHTLPETNSSPLKIGHPNRKVVLQPSIFRSYVSFREGIIYYTSWVDNLGIKCLKIFSFGGRWLGRPTFPDSASARRLELGGWDPFWQISGEFGGISRT